MMEDPAKVHADRLAWEMGSWTAIELQVEIEFVNKAKLASTELDSYRGTLHYVETASGQRLSEERIVNEDDEVHTTINYSDGKLAAQHLKSEGAAEPSDQIAIKQSFGGEESGQTKRPEPLKYFYVGLTPLPEALPTAKFLGEGRHLRRDCDRFLFSGVTNNQGTLEFVYWLDRESSIPLRVECFDKDADRIEDHPNYTWSAESIGSFEGHVLPETYSLLRYLSGGPDLETLRFRIDGTVREVHYDRSYPASTFWPTASESTTVVDYVKGDVTIPERPLDEVTSGTAAPIVAVRVVARALGSADRLRRGGHHRRHLAGMATPLTDRIPAGRPSATIRAGPIGQTA